MESNRRIFEWLEPDGCWHEPAHTEFGGSWIWNCPKCGLQRSETQRVLKGLYMLVSGERLNHPLDRDAALKEAGKWF